MSSECAAESVPAGYKQTELGVIPEDWEVDKLANFWDVTDCKHVTAYFVPNGFPIASIKEVQSRFVDLTDAKQTTKDFYDLLIEGKRKPEVGDLILSRNATVGEIAQVTEWHPLFAMGQDVCLLRKKSSTFSTDYLQSVFRSSIIGYQVSDLMVGSTFKRINVQNIKDFIVPMPQQVEQDAIAQVLTDADALIESLEQLIVKKRQIKQGAMQELLTGKRRLPGFSEDWENKQLDELGSTFGGLTGKNKRDFGHGNYYYITFMNIMMNVIIDCSTFQKVDIKLTEVQNHTLKGDIFFNGSSETPEEVGMCSVLLDEVHDVFLNSFCFGFRIHDGAPVDGLYLAYYFRSQEGRRLLKAMAQGATRYNLSKSALVKLSFSLPQHPEQVAIASILSDMDAEIASLEEKLEKSRMLKQGIMQELLTGRIRLV